MANGGQYIFVTGATSAWHLKMDMLDLEIGHFLPFGNNFSLQPHFKIRGGWINQTQSITYTNILSPTVVFVSSNASILRTNNFAAIGPRIGLNSRWGGYVGNLDQCGNWRANLGIFGNISAAMLYADYHVNLKYHFESAPPKQNGTIADDKFRLRSMMQMLLGVDWIQWYKKQWGFSLKAGYEVQYWWNQLQVVGNSLGAYFIGQGDSNGDLTFQGLTLEAALLF